MQQGSGVMAVAHVIELSVAPVFLLSAMGAILSVMTGRLSRLIDHARALAQAALAQRPPDPSVAVELRVLSHRATLISRSITLCVTTALLICGVIVVMFFGAFVQIDTSMIAAWLFIAGMTIFCIALVTLLREISIAALRTQVELERAAAVHDPSSN